MLIRGFGEVGNVTGAIQTLQKMALRGLAPTKESYNAAVCSMCAVGDIAAARKMIEVASDEGMKLDAWSWGSVLEVLFHHCFFSPLASFWPLAISAA
jgi:pentatricopeptide repeat protein